MQNELTIGIVIAVISLIFIVLVASFICYMLVFHTQKRKPKDPDYFPLPDGDVYKPLHEGMIEWMKLARSMPRERLEIKSYDGLKLVGYYYEHKPGAPIEILFHGYKGDGERDLAGGIERCFKIGRSAIIVDQRGHGESEGSSATFGIKERRDCVSWARFVAEKFGPDVKIIIAGVSMGAATVMMASAEELPENVVCVLADCGYNSPKEIIIKVVKEMKLPAAIVYPFIRLGGIIFGGFDIEETSPLEAVKKTELPIIFIHGDTDDFVPHYMSVELYEACGAQHKRFVTIEGAGHGIAYPINKEKYLDALREFEEAAGFLK